MAGPRTDFNVLCDVAANSDDGYRIPRSDIQGESGDWPALKRLGRKGLVRHLKGGGDEMWKITPGGTCHIEWLKDGSRKT